MLVTINAELNSIHAKKQCLYKKNLRHKSAKIYVLVSSVVFLDGWFHSLKKKIVHLSFVKFCYFIIFFDLCAM